jgi:hypothetical protein
MGGVFLWKKGIAYLRNVSKEVLSCIKEGGYISDFWEGEGPENSYPFFLMGHVNDPAWQSGRKSPSHGNGKWEE